MYDLLHYKKTWQVAGLELSSNTQSMMDFGGVTKDNWSRRRVWNGFIIMYDVVLVRNGFNIRMDV